MADSQGITITTITGSTTYGPSSPSPAPVLDSARSPMRARPRLPAGPRTRKQTTFAQRPPPLEDTSKDQDPSFQQIHEPPSDPAPAWTITAHGSDIQLSDPFSPSPVPLLSTPIPPQPTVNRQREPSVPPVDPGQSLPSHPSASPSPDPSQTTSSLSHSHLPLQDRPISPQLPFAQGTSRPGTPAPFPTFSSSLTNPVPRKPSQTTVSSATAPPLVLPAAQMNLSPEPLPYKHLTLDAAHWTLTSAELQSLVSGAIRESAKEKFIRLLPPTIIDTQMPEDAAHIEHSWDTAAARWRFEAHRRNMLLRALAASGADSDLLAQLSGTLSNLDSYAQDLLHAEVQRTQLTTARDSHRASSLAVALRKLNASYARRTRDLDKARAHIAALRSEIDEAWKVAEEQATQIDGLRAAALERGEKTTTGSGDSVTGDDHPEDDDASGSHIQDGESADLTTISRAEVIDVTGKAVAAQARLTTMRTDHPSGLRAPPSAFGSRYQPSSMTPGTDNPLHRQPSTTSQVSRVSAARKRSKRKSKASLRLPASVSARSKSRGKKGKEPAEHPLPWLPADAEGSFLEMEGRPAGEDCEEDGSEGDGGDDGRMGGGLSPSGAQTAGPPPHPPLSALIPAPEGQALLVSKVTSSSPASPPSPLNDDAPAAARVPLVHRSTSGQGSQCSYASTPSIYPSTAAPSIASTPILPPSSGSHRPPLPSRPRSDGADAREEVVRAGDLIPDPASIFSVATTASAPDLARRRQSLDMRSPISDSGSKQHNHASAKIRRSFSQLLHLGNSSRTRRRSVPFAFKVHSAVVGSGTSASSLTQDSRGELHWGEGSEEGWEDTREDDE